MIILVVRMMANGAIILNLTTKKEHVVKNIFVGQKMKNIPWGAVGGGEAVHSPEPMAHKRECECFWVVVLWLGKARKKHVFIVHPLLVGQAEAVKTNPKIGTQTADSGSRNSSPSQPVKVAQTGILVRSGTPTETSRLKNQTPRAADFRQTWQSISGPWVCHLSAASGA